MLDQIPISKVTENYAPFTAREYEALREDIRQNGQKNPILLHRGAIVDGRHRYRACLELGIEPKTIEFLGTTEQMQAHVRSLNEKRRSRTKPLTVKEKRRLVVEEIEKAEPGTSNREIARRAGVGHKMVNAIVSGACSSHENNNENNNKPKRNCGGRPGVPLRSLDPTRSICEQFNETAGSVSEKAKKLGINWKTAARISDLISINKSRKTNADERTLAQDAINFLEEKRSVDGAYRMVAPIKKRIWGGKKSNSRQADTERFLNGVHHLAGASISLVEPPIDELTVEQIEEATEQLEDAAKAISGALRKLRKGKDNA